jgi:hypothetical protein
MFCERTKEGAAQATAGEFQEERKNGEASLRALQKGTNVHVDKTNKKWSAALTVSVSNKIFFLQIWNETYVKKL